MIPFSEISILEYEKYSFYLFNEKWGVTTLVLSLSRLEKEIDAP